MVLAVQADVQNILQTVFTNQPESVITDLLGRASAMVETYLHRNVEENAGEVETLDGHGARTTLFLVRTPVTAVASVVEDGVSLTLTDDYLFYEDGRLVRTADGNRDLWWDPKRQSIVVTYTGGYATIPRDIADTTARLVARWFQAGAAYAAAPDSAGAVKSIALDGSDDIEYSDAVLAVSMNAGFADAEKEALNPYRRTVFA